MKRKTLKTKIIALILAIVLLVAVPLMTASAGEPGPYNGYINITVNGTSTRLANAAMGWGASGYSAGTTKATNSIATNVSVAASISVYDSLINSYYPLNSVTFIDPSKASASFNAPSYITVLYCTTTHGASSPNGGTTISLNPPE